MKYLVKKPAKILTLKYKITDAIGEIQIEMLEKVLKLTKWA